jgi:small subunit ribosomal protein S1
VKVLGLDKENRKLNLGVKQLEEDPWEVFASVLDINSNHEGTVMEVNDKGAMVSLMYGIEAFCPARHTKKEDGSKMLADEKLPFAILEFSKDDKKILVSHTRTWEAVKEEAEKKEKKTTKDAVAKNNSKNAEKTTLGDLDVLSELKQKMEDNDKK